MRLLSTGSLSACAAITIAQNVVLLTPNASVSQAIGSLSQVLSPSFAGFGLEPSNLYSFTGAREPNLLSLNLLQNLANYTGVPPHFRIGGNTQDNMVYVADWNHHSLATNPSPQGNGQVPWDLYTFGPRYFEALDRFPSGTPITYGLSLSYDFANWTDEIVATADAARSMLNQTKLVSFEIGNEPNLYLQNEFRNGSWSGQVYTQEWLSRANVVYQQVLKPHAIPADFFEPTCTSSTIGTSFEITQLAEQDGIQAPANGSENSTTPYLSLWNQHDYYYYQNISNYNLVLDQLMDLSTTSDQFQAWEEQVQQAFLTGHPYVLREYASVGPEGEQGLSDVFGATLWTLNAMLYFATLNISSVQFHMTDNSYAAAWQPVDHDNGPARVRSTYYAFAAMAQLIGPGCTTRVQSVPISQYPPGYENRLGAYATYQQGILAALVLFNSKLANSSGPSSSISWNVRLPSIAGQTVFLSYLTAAGADAASNTTWNGISYEQNGDGTPSVANSTVVAVPVGSDGSFSASVRDSQALVVNIGYQMGTGPSVRYNQTACEILASSQPVPSPDAVHTGGSPTHSFSPTSSGKPNEAAHTISSPFRNMWLPIITTIVSFAFGVASM